MLEIDGRRVDEVLIRGRRLNALLFNVRFLCFVMPARESASDFVEFGHWHSLSVVGAGKTHLVGHDDIGYHLRGEDVLRLSVQ